MYKPGAGPGKLICVVDRYQNNWELNDKTIDLKLAEYQTVSTKQVYLLRYIQLFCKRCIVLDETAVVYWNIFALEMLIFFRWALSRATWD